MIQGGLEENRMRSKRNTGKKRRTPKKAGEHRKNEELSSSTGKTGRASGKSGEAKEKSGVSFTTPGK